MSNKTRRAPKGAGSIRKRSDKCWEARYTIGYDPKTGKQIQRTVYGPTQKEVRQKLVKITAEVDQGSYLEPSDDTVAVWLDLWLDTYAAVSVKPYTLDSYRTICDRHIKPGLGSRKLQELSPIAIQAFYNDLLRKDKLSPKTVKNIHGVLHRALDRAVKNRVLISNACDLCELPRAARTEIHPLTRDEIQRFVEKTRDHPYGRVFMTTLFTGMRQGEVLGLTWDCVDFEKGSILIDKQLQKSKKVGGEYVLVSTKTDKKRTITVAPSVMNVLRQQLEDQESWKAAAGAAWQNEWNLVFTNAVGEHLCHFTVYKKYKKVVEKLGMPDRRFHDLRHSFGLASLENGDDIKTVQEHLGHSSASFTLDVYGHVSEEMQRTSADRMEAYIKSISSK